MNIFASIQSQSNQLHVVVDSNGNQKTLAMPAKPDGKGSAVNGGELLFLALATCCCNDIYREAMKRNLEITAVQVSVSGEFGAEGEPGRNISYDVNVESPNSREDIEELINYVDSIAEIHNTLRGGAQVRLVTR